MPERETLERVRNDAQAGKSPGAQAGEFVREEIHHVRGGKHSARSPTKNAPAQDQSSGWGKEACMSSERGELVV